MTKPNDDLEAVRIIAEALQGFPKDEQERILRWSREKVGLSAPAQGTRSENVAAAAPALSAQLEHAAAPTDIRSFLTQKDPKSDNQLAAAVAYYYRFQVPEGQQKDGVTADDLQEACRLAGRKRLKKPGQTLINALNQGLLDKAEKGKYSINTVGENLVAMVLPGAGKAEPMKRTKKKNQKRK